MNIFNLFLAGVLAISSIFSGSYESRLGVTIATTSQSDTIGTFRTNVNTSLENIKTDLESVSSTQGTYGTIVTEDTPLRIVKGGTELSTYPSDSQLLSANGTSTAWKTLTSDGSITIATTTTSTQISTAGVNTADNFNWTGVHTFSAGVTSTATTTLTGTTTISGITTLSGNTISINGTTTFSGATTTFSNNDVHNGTSTFNGNMVGALQGILISSSTALSSSSAVFSIPTGTKMIIVSGNGRSSSCANPDYAQIVLFNDYLKDNLHRTSCTTDAFWSLQGTISGSTLTVNQSAYTYLTANSTEAYFFR